MIENALHHGAGDFATPPASRRTPVLLLAIRAERSLARRALRDAAPSSRPFRRRRASGPDQRTRHSEARLSPAVQNRLVIARRKLGSLPRGLQLHPPPTLGRGYAIVTLPGMAFVKDAAEAPRERNQADWRGRIRARYSVRGDCSAALGRYRVGASAAAARQLVAPSERTHCLALKSDPHRRPLLETLAKQLTGSVVFFRRAPPGHRGSDSPSDSGRPVRYRAVGRWRRAGCLMT